MSSIAEALPTTGPLARTAAGILDDGNRFLPLPAQLATLLPQGGIRRGGTLRITPSPGATSLLMCLLAEPVRAGSWAAVVNIPDFGAEAAAELGVPLNRLAFVPTPGDQWLEVTATLLDNLDLVAIRPPSRCRGVDARRLAARTRQRNSVLIISSLPDVTRPNWPEPADVDLSTTASEWKGLQAGHGRLRYRELTITASGRRLPGRRQTRITVTESVPQPGKPTPAEGQPSGQALGGAGGRMPPQSVGVTGAGGEPRVLPKLSHHEELPSPMGLTVTLSRPRPTVDELRIANVIGAGWEHFSAQERQTAQWLADQGLPVTSVQARGAHKVRTPDAVALTRGVTLEIKRFSSRLVSTLRDRLRDARRQSSRVVIDARDAGIDERTALEALAAELARRGGDYDEVLIVLTDSSAVSWP